METVKTYGGNGQEIIRNMPLIVILTQNDYNDIALAHIAENTGLYFVRASGGYSAQPTESSQVVRLFMTYNFKTQYHDNWDSKNTLYIKDDHHTGFKVDSICYECCKHNYIPCHGLSEDSRLAC